MHSINFCKTNSKINTIHINEILSSNNSATYALKSLIGAPRGNVLMNILAKPSVWQTARLSTNFCERSERIELINSNSNFEGDL